MGIILKAVRLIAKLISYIAISGHVTTLQKTPKTMKGVGEVSISINRPYHLKPNGKGGKEQGDAVSTSSSSAFSLDSERLNI